MVSQNVYPESAPGVPERRLADALVTGTETAWPVVERMARECLLLVWMA